MLKIFNSQFSILNFRRKRAGFTLIELLVVISIIGILASLLLVSYQGTRKTARDGKRKVDLEQIRSALEMCRTDTNSYPISIYTDLSGTPVISCGSPSQTYLSGTPKDPATQDNYYYNRATASTYTLCAYLEVSGTAGSCGTSSCGSGRTCNYKVTNP